MITGEIVINYLKSLLLKISEKYQLNMPWIIIAGRIFSEETDKNGINPAAEKNENRPDESCWPVKRIFMVTWWG